jgi:hypothetical protein
MMNAEQAKESFDIAVDHGFLPEIEDIVGALEAINGEMVECVECEGDLNSSPHYDGIVALVPSEINAYTYEKMLAHTPEMELADVALRGATLAHYYKSSFKDSAATSLVDIDVCGMSTIHQLKFYIGQLVAKCLKWDSATTSYKVNPDNIYLIIHAVEKWCCKQGIDINWFVQVKMNYNKQREYLHGKGGN